jgi:hypothetical protein
MPGSLRGAWPTFPAGSAADDGWLSSVPALQDAIKIVPSAAPTRAVPRRERAFMEPSRSSHYLIADFQGEGATGGDAPAPLRGVERRDRAL